MSKKYLKKYEKHKKGHSNHTEEGGGFGRRKRRQAMSFRQNSKNIEKTIHPQINTHINEPPSHHYPNKRPL